MVPYFSIIFGGNQWLSSCNIELNKNNMPDKITCDEWIKIEFWKINTFVFLQWI